MPKLLEETEIRLELVDLKRMTPLHKPTRNGVVIEPARSEGVHLSDILRYIAVKSHMLKPGEPLESEYPLRMAVGLAWEWFCFALYPSVCHQPERLFKQCVPVHCLRPSGFRFLDLRADVVSKTIRRHEHPVDLDLARLVADGRVKRKAEPLPGETDRHPERILAFERLAGLEHEHVALDRD